MCGPGAGEGGCDGQGAGEGGCDGQGGQLADRACHQSHPDLGLPQVFDWKFQEKSLKIFFNYEKQKNPQSFKNFIKSIVYVYAWRCIIYVP